MTLRRSSRAANPKKGISDYNDGDIVEIDRGHGNIVRGRLAQLLTEGTSPNPRWLIKFDGQPYKDEEMYERAFGKLLQSAVGEEAADEKAPNTVLGTTTTTTTGSNKRSRGTGAISGTSSEGEKSDGSSSSSKKSKKKKTTKDNKKKKVSSSVQFEETGTGATSGGDGLSDDSSPSGGETAGCSKADRASAREARSKRRQAKIDEEVVVGQVSDFSGGKRKLVGAAAQAAAKKFKTKDFDGEVTKIKMLTGTLFLYRGGAQRRVEFVPRV